MGGEAGVHTLKTHHAGCEISGYRLWHKAISVKKHQQCSAVIATNDEEEEKGGSRDFSFRKE